MKKSISKILTAFSLISALFFSSCDGVIFYTIRDEVELDDAEISGDIAKVVRYQLDGVENVFVANGKIYCRSVDTAHDASGNEVEFTDSVANSKIDWTTFAKPSGIVYDLAADSQYLYAVAIIYDDDDDGYNVPTTRTVYCYDSSSSSWTSIFSATYSSSVSSRLFCTNAPKNDNRKAYFRYGSDIYELNGTAQLGDDIAAGFVYATADNASVGTFTTPEDSSSTAFNPLSCAYFNGTVYFTALYAMTTNETLDDEASYLYYATGDNVYYSTDASTWTPVDLSCDTILSLAVTQNYLIAGTDEGIVHTPYTTKAENDVGGIPTEGTADFDTNADSTLSSYYEVNSVLVIDPSLGEYDGTIYASIDMSGTSASLNNIGLWSYYAYKGKWNRE